MRLAIALSLIVPLGLSAQRPTSATYITDADVKTVLATPGIDHTIRVVDIGNENFAIGVIHRTDLFELIENTPQRRVGIGNRALREVLALRFEALAMFEELLPVEVGRYRSNCVRNPSRADDASHATPRVMHGAGG